MKYVKLIDYLDKPWAIRHIHNDGSKVAEITYNPQRNEYSQVKVIFLSGGYGFYHTDGRAYENDRHSWFVLKEEYMGESITNRSKVYKAIDSEREYQEQIWSTNNKSSGATSISAYILWMERYLHVARELASTTDETTGTETANEIMATIRKVAGLAVACGEVHGMPTRSPNEGRE